MAIMKETDPRFVNIEKKIGLFVITSIIALTAVVVFIGLEQDVFSPKTTLYFVTDSGKELNEGIAVKLSGFKIGKVKGLFLEDVAFVRVRVELSINKKYMKWIKKDSKAKMTKEGLIGEGIIEITPGSQDAMEIEEGAMIDFERVGIFEMAEELKAEVKPMLTEIKQIIQYVNDPKADIKQSLSRIKNLLDDVSTTKQYVDGLLKTVDKNILSTTKKIDSLMDSTQQTLTTTDNMLKKIDNDLPYILKKSGNTLENVQKITTDIKNTLGQSSPQIPSILRKGNQIADGTKDLLDSVKKIWPIRSHIKEPKEKTLKVDSYE